MAHEIWSLDSPMYSRKPAWHGLGTVVTEAPTSEDALKLASLDWEVGLEPVYGQGSWEIPDAFVTARQDLPQDDSRRFLGIVGKRYNPIQNVQAFSLADALVGEGARFETAGSLKNGRIVWMLAKLPNDQTIGRDDKLENYLLLRTSHDGTSALDALLTTVRVVCNNTLSVAMGRMKAANRVKVRHTKSAQVNIGEARRILGLAKDHLEEQANRFQLMADTSVDSRFAEAFSKSLFPDKENQNNTRAQNARHSIGRIFNRTQATGEVSGDAYGLYNALTEYLDHTASRPQSTSKSLRQVNETRFTSILDGSIAKQRQAGFDLIGRAYGIDGNGRGIVEQVLERVETGETWTPTVDDVLAGIAL